MNEKFLNFFSKYGLLIVIIISIFFRLYNLSTTPPGLYPDEAMNGNNAQEALDKKEFKIFYPENNGREGLFINIQALAIDIFKVHKPWVLRLPSALFGILTIIGIYFFVKKIFQKEKYADFIAFLCSFSASISFWHINFSRIGFRAIMAPAFMIWSVYFLIWALEKINNLNAKYREIFLISATSGLIYGLGMHSYIAYRATPLIIIFIYKLYWLFYKPNFKKLLFSFVIFVLASLITFLPLGIYFLKNPHDFFGRTSQVSIFNSKEPLKNLSINTLKTLAMFNIKGDSNWRHNYSESPQIYWLLGIFFLLGIFIKGFKAIKQLLKHSPQREDFLWFVSVFWILVSMLPVIISNEGIPHALRSILMIPAVFIITGLGLFEIILFISKYLKPKTFVSVLIILATGLIIQSYFQYFIAWAKNPNVKDAFSQRYTEIGESINNMSANIPKYVVVNASGVLVRGIPMPSQTVMFITDTFTKEKQLEKNVYYITPEEEKNIPQNAIVFYLEPKEE